MEYIYTSYVVNKNDYYFRFETKGIHSTAALVSCSIYCEDVCPGLSVTAEEGSLGVRVYNNTPIFLNLATYAHKSLWLLSSLYSRRCTAARSHPSAPTYVVRETRALHVLQRAYDKMFCVPSLFIVSHLFSWAKPPCTPSSESLALLCILKVNPIRNHTDGCFSRNISAGCTRR